MVAFDVSYTYDPAGNRKTMVDNLTGDATTYTYDAANELLTSEGPGGVTTFTYDQAGNRTRKETPSTLTDYAYDALGRLTLAEPVAGDVTFTYNGDGQRVSKQTATQTRKYLYDHQRLLQELDDGDNPLKTYTFTSDEYGDLISEYDMPLGTASGNGLHGFVRMAVSGFSLSPNNLSSRIYAPVPFIHSRQGMY